MEHVIIPNHQKVFVISTITLNNGAEVHRALRPVVAWSQETDVNGNLVMLPICGAVPPFTGGYVECYCLGGAIVNSNGTIHDGDTHWKGIEHFLMSCTGRDDPIGVEFIPSVTQAEFMELIK